MSLDRIEQPSETPDVGTVWGNLLRSMSRGLRGLWGSIPWEPVVSGSASVSDSVAIRQGVMAWVSVSVSGNGTDFTVSLPWAVADDVAFACSDGSALAVAGGQEIIVSGAGTPVVITGQYRAREV